MMALTPTQLNTKSKAVMPGPKTSDELIHYSTFGRLRGYPNKGIQANRLHAGQMIMLDRGLYRVLKSETIAYDVYMGPRCSLTNAEAAGSTSLELKNIESGISSFPAGTKILIGGRDAGETLEVVTSSTSTSVSSATATVSLASALVKAFKADVVATILYAPAGFESEFRSILDLEPDNRSDDTEGLAYVVPCVPAMPAYIGRDGSTNVTVEQDDSVLANGVDNGGVDKNYINMGQGLHNQTGADIHATAADYADVGYAFGNSHKVRVGLSSPKIFIDQPTGTRMFFGSEANQLSFSKTGFIDAHVSPEWEPNNLFGLWIGVGERSLPRFKLLVDNGIAIENPRVRLIGIKYSIRPVGTPEVKKMMARSGSFNYETIPSANEAAQKVRGTDSPADGWYQHVRKMKKRGMNRSEYENAISQASNITRNILSGSRSSYGANTPSTDPREEHR